ncbi:unnamed protein product [Ambrosiozyma monospora]|uniref:Unnamed protein product n=1 Tax=Ambrosiozyma monospora TaxID=43982 RepID=A0A9W7DNC5_AMBMO|nr:unnamed protein product [Ambrosiozyma monospora]
MDDSSNNSMRLLLDDSLYDSMVKLEAKAKEMLGDVLEVVQTPVPKEVKLIDFIEDRNLNVLTLVYHSIPILSHIMNTVENIDFTVFIMIKKLSKGARLGGTGGRGQFSGGSRFTGGGMTSRQDTITDLEEDLVGSNSQFYETTAKSLELMISEFMHLKQNFHTMVTMLILDSQNLTVEDPETFNGLRDDGVVYNPQARQTEVAKLAKAVQDSLATQSMENDYVYDGNLKLITTIHDLELQINLLIESVSQLKEQRTNIMNYCSRLMNTDFNVASLFIAERHNTMVSSVVTAPSEYLFERNSTLEGESVPWFMDLDDEEKSLIYDSSGLKGGSVAGLVAKLVDPVMPEEPEFVDTMLTFFATFTTPMQLFTLLIDKYRLDLPEGLSYEEYNAWLEKKFKPQQTRVISVFEKLFSKYWLVHYTSDALIAKWRDFVDSSPIISQEQRNLGMLVMEIKTQQEYFDCFGNGNPEPIKVPENPPSPKADFQKLRDVMKIRLLHIDALELARQITLIQFSLFSKINRTDLIARTYNFAKVLKDKDALKSSKNIANFIQNCNQITHFTICLVLARHDIYDRRDTIQYFIAVAENLMRMKNFSSMTAIISGLSSTSISRLKKTWELIPKTVLLNFHKMDNLMSIGKNYSER